MGGGGRLGFAVHARAPAPADAASMKTPRIPTSELQIQRLSSSTQRRGPPKGNKDSLSLLAPSVADQSNSFYS